MELCSERTRHQATRVDQYRFDTRLYTERVNNKVTIKIRYKGNTVTYLQTKKIWEINGQEKSWKKRTENRQL